LSAADGAPPEQIRVQVVHGHPLVDRAAEIYTEMLSAAGVDSAGTLPPPQGRAPMRTSFHVATDVDGTALGVVMVTMGNLEDLAIEPLVEPDQRLAAPICEAPAIAVLPEHTGRGVTELLYRSVYCFARRQEARSLATLVDPLTLELFREDYGIMFRALGPITSHRGLELVAAGEELHTLEEHLRRNRPEFLDFLTEPFTPAERIRFGL
jgi:GNAT superfamily N-acetyltransferase